MMTNQQDKQIEVLLSLGLLKFSLEYSSIHTFRTHIDKHTLILHILFVNLFIFSFVEWLVFRKSWR